MSVKGRWVQEFEQHLDQQLEQGLDWAEAAEYAAIRADQETAEAAASETDFLSDWLRDETALGSIEGKEAV